MYRLTQLCRTRFAATVAASVLALSLSGCTSLPDYIHNGFKVGPNYCKPPAPVAKHWIDAADMRAPNVPGIQCRWWTVFHDPKLDELIACAYRQNLTLREAGFRILAARAALNIQIGNLFPQDQIARGAYTRSATPTGPTTPVAYTSFWSYGFNLNWQLDFWGRFRRAVAAAEDTLDARVADYDAAVVTMLGDVASNYVRIRTTQERIDLLRANVKLQQGVLDFIEARLAAGYRQTNLDRAQALSNLRQDEAAIPVLEIAKRQYEDALCVLLGIPAVSIEPMLGIGPIPVSPPDVALGIPCDLLRRRPDVRSAERLAAAQAEAIGIAEADLYPSFFINGSLGYSAQFFPDLFRNTAFTGSVGPSFQWNVLNYGRIINNVRLQDATFQQLVAVYQQTVITASQEVEDGIIAFLKSQRAQPASRRERGGRQGGRRRRGCPVHERDGRFQPLRHHRAKHGYAAGPGRAIERQYRAGADSDVSSVGGRLGNSFLRPAAAATAAGQRRGAAAWCPERHGAAPSAASHPSEHAATARGAAATGGTAADAAAGTTARVPPAVGDAATAGVPATAGGAATTARPAAGAIPALGSGLTPRAASFPRAVRVAGSEPFRRADGRLADAIRDALVGGRRPAKSRTLMPCLDTIEIAEKRSAFSLQRVGYASA